jgi:electron transport complex protein RnfE
MEIIFEAYLPGLRDSLGIYFPLLAVNTFLLEAIVFGEQGERNEWYGSLLFGLVYLGTIAFVGAFREIVGSGNLTLFVLPGWTLRYAILTKPLQPIRFFILPAGGLILYGYLKAGFRLMVTPSNRRRVEEEP